VGFRSTKVYSYDISNAYTIAYTLSLGSVLLTTTDFFETLHVLCLTLELKLTIKGNCFELAV